MSYNRVTITWRHIDTLVSYNRVTITWRHIDTLVSYNKVINFHLRRQPIFLLTVAHSKLRIIDADDPLHIVWQEPLLRI